MVKLYNLEHQDLDEESIIQINPKMKRVIKEEPSNQSDFGEFIAEALGDKRGKQSMNQEVVDSEADVEAKNSIKNNKTKRIQIFIPKEFNDLHERREKEHVYRINRIQRGIPRELVRFRKQWKEKSYLPEETKQKIIEAAESIPLRVQKENKKDKNDGTMRIEFLLNGKYYKFLDIDGGVHSDEKYLSGSNDTDRKYVSSKGMIGPISKWDNEKQKMYVMEKMRDGFKERSTEEDMKPLLRELGKLAGLEREPEQMAMLEYLTGMTGWYRGGMIDENSRSQMLCSEQGCQFYSNTSFFAKLCLFSCSQA